MFTQTVAIARCLLTEGRLTDVDRMISPLPGKGVSKNGVSASHRTEDTLFLRCLLAQARLFSNTSPREVIKLFPEELESAAGPAATLDQGVAMYTMGLALLHPEESTRDLPRALHFFQAAAKTFKSLYRSDHLHWPYLGQAAALYALGEEKEAGACMQHAGAILSVLNDRIANKWFIHLSAAITHQKPIPFEALYQVSLQSNGVNGTRGDGLRLATIGAEKVFISDQMQHLLQAGRRAAKGSAPLLLLGERGSGKETLARYIHNARSAERNIDGEATFEAIDCNAIAGAWDVMHYLDEIKASNPDTQQTLFLNHVEHLTPSQQQALLAFLQKVDAGDGYQELPIRIISASSAELPALVAQGMFDANLYHRLKIRTLEIPPLRMHRQDIPLLAIHFAALLRPKGVSSVVITDHALTAFLNYDWPGNIRQLRNEIERILVHVGMEPLPTIDIENISESILKKKSHTWALDEKEIEAEYPLEEILAHTEKTVIERVLDKYKGQVSASADALGLTRQGLYKKLKRLGIRLSH